MDVPYEREHGDFDLGFLSSASSRGSVSIAVKTESIK